MVGAIYAVEVAAVCGGNGCDDTFLITPAAASVAYDHKAVIINGQRRTSSLMWPNLIQQAKDGGLTSYRPMYSGMVTSPLLAKYDLVRFIKLVQQGGLYVNLRIGPYICASGISVWLKYVPGIQFRTDNEPFKTAMKNFTSKIVSLMKSESLFEWQGGPIILAQIENEFGPLEWDQGQPAKTYAAWAAQMAVGLDTRVPWIMCKEDDAPDPVYHGGTNFGRTVGGPFIATSYDYDAPIDEFDRSFETTQMGPLERPSQVDQIVNRL
ncbi:hypothetical protein HPP92_009130 [Vanilla planifolia]|uniref:beta-galactosidase n=1 Tax=Vanilla planifolia TaxID=51239 RepID=A0A835V6N4_VANPL|nr:hypothetical protein HPP92_009130 [Vanilla planifolia]